MAAATNNSSPSNSNIPQNVKPNNTNTIQIKNSTPKPAPPQHSYPPRSNSFSNPQSNSTKPNNISRDFYQPTPGTKKHKKKRNNLTSLFKIATAVGSRNSNDINLKQWFKEIKKTHQRKQD